MKFDDHPDWDDLDHRLAAVTTIMRGPPAAVVGDLLASRDGVPIPRRGSPAAGLAELVSFIDDVPEDRLCGIGVGVLEMLVDIDWPEIADELEAALRAHANLRKALSCVWWHDEEAQARLVPLIGPDDDIGHRVATERPRDRWERVHDAPIRQGRIADVVRLLDNARRAGLPRSFDVSTTTAERDPQHVQFVWPRFRCTATDAATPVFYRCGVRLFCPGSRPVEVAAEADFVADDVDALDEAPAWRIAAFLRDAFEHLPGIDER